MGLLKGRIEDFSSPLAGLPARLFAGFFFFKYGLAKATGGFDGAALRQTLAGWSADAYPVYLPFLKTVAIPWAGAFAFLVVFGEIAIGLALLLGSATRLAALLGMVLCANFVLATGAALVSVERPVVFLVLLATVYATAAGRSLGIDHLLKGKVPVWIA